MAEPRTRDLFLLQNDPEAEKEIQKLADYYKLSLDQAKDMYLSDGLKLEETPSYQIALEKGEVEPLAPEFKGLTPRFAPKKLEDVTTIYEPGGSTFDPEAALKELDKNYAQGNIDRRAYFTAKKKIVKDLPVVPSEIGKKPGAYQGRPYEGVSWQGIDCQGQEEEGQEG